MIRKMVKWGLVTAATLVVLGVLLGPDRVRDLTATAREAVVQEVDGMIDPEVQLANEIRQMEREYPRQIATLRAQVREIDRALAEVEEEVALTREVTNLCDADLQLLEAEETGALRQAAILRTRKAYARREALAREETQALESERQRVQAELASLEQEAQEFQMQVALLEREIESLQRSDMLIDIARQRRALEERTITTRATTALERVHRAIDERREEQAEQLRAMQLEESNLEYEARARLVLHQS